MMMIRQPLQKNLSLRLRKHPAGIPLSRKKPTATVKKKGISYDGKIIYQKFHASYLRAAIFAGILSAATIPTILLSPLGGILADRADRRNIMASLSYLIAPMLGGVLYAMFGLKPVMYASVVCFLITALFECFIRFSYQRIQSQGGVFQIVKQDFLSSMQYISKERQEVSA